MTALARFAALADDPVRLVQQCEALRLCFNAALDALTEAHATIANQQRMIQEMRAGARLSDAELCGWTPAHEPGDES